MDRYVKIYFSGGRRECGSPEEVTGGTIKEELTRRTACQTVCLREHSERRAIEDKGLRA